MGKGRRYRLHGRSFEHTSAECDLQEAEFSSGSGVEERTAILINCSQEKTDQIRERSEHHVGIAPSPWTASLYVVEITGAQTFDEGQRTHFGGYAVSQALEEHLRKDDNIEHPGMVSKPQKTPNFGPISNSPKRHLASQRGPESCARSRKA